MLKNKPKIVQAGPGDHTEAVLLDRIRQLKTANAELEWENQGLRARFTDGKRMPWDLAKVARQRRALDRLNRRVRSQRRVLRALNDLGRGLTRDEYLALDDQGLKWENYVDEFGWG